MHLNFFFLPDQEFAEALKEFSPDHEGIQDAKHSVEELEKLKHELEQKRKSQLEEAKKQQEGRVCNDVDLNTLFNIVKKFHRGKLNFRYEFYRICLVDISKEKLTVKLNAFWLFVRYIYEDLYCQG